MISTIRKWVIVALAASITLFIIYFSGAWFGLYGNKQDLRQIENTINPQQKISTQSIPESFKSANKQILFGDFHVHTTFSMDAFQNNLPIMQGEGTHPPADACNFARFCSALDFYSINDHAESLTPERWQQTKDSIQQCNAVSSDANNPDMVAFLGWEWTNIGKTAEEHFGHKNVILRDFKDADVPTRPIAAKSQAFEAMRTADVGMLKLLGPLLDFESRQEIYDIDKFIEDTQKEDVCPENVHVKDLPKNCMELASTPAELFTKLHEWDMPAVVIPHGTSWGNTTPATAEWYAQLSNGNHDPKLQTAIEIFSGHGNSEGYRPWRAALKNPDGGFICPEPSNGFVPECWQAGEIIRDRCLIEGAAELECEQRAEKTRHDFLLAGKAGFKVVGGSVADEWQESGQCTDCYAPTYHHRPAMGVQAALAVRNFNAGEGEEDRFRFGIIGSSDNHSARSGTGFKEVERLGFTDSHGPKSTWLYNKLRKSKAPASSSIAMDPKKYFRGSNKERSNSFMYTGGLVAVHSEGRDRQSIWDAVQRNEIYSTSGPRIMLWFELSNGPEKNLKNETMNGIFPMGQSLNLTTAPTFKIKALGSFKQKPGCPKLTTDTLGSDDLERLCKGECYNPSDERIPIVRVEVIKINPQITPDEPLDSLINDSWKTFECPAEGEGCEIEFTDNEYTEAARDAVYYVRALQQATPTINGDNLRCEYNEEGVCIKVNACYVDARTASDDDCLGDKEERAWSSPIFVDYKK